MELREPPSYTQLPNSSLETKLQSLIKIYHPGYTPPAPLIVLRAFDDGKLLYNMVYIACCIILGNVWTDDEGYDTSNTTGPFLSLSSEPGNTRFIPQDSMIPAGTYYLHYPGYRKRRPYPIVPHFNHWKFPDKLPKSWEELRSPTTSRASTTSSSRSRIPSAYDPERMPCPLTGQVSVLERSHILPSTTTTTFIKRNNMRRFLRSHKFAPMHLNPGNTIFFRKDCHTLWDSNAITFVPKPDSSERDRLRLVCHVLNPPGKSVDSDMEIYSLYHNTPILPIHHPIEFLFARFGWSLFTSHVIVLFADDDGKSKYSVLIRDMKKDKIVDELCTVASLPRLTTKAAGIEAKQVAGEKHDLDDSELFQVGEPEDVSDRFYSVRTGLMERFDDGAESGDCSLSSHSSHDPFSDLSDDSEPPRKKSRS
ncbi:hypothetical protein F5Y11DRAFT_348877 [Daldinia sp. FL1419]|nr:hypothetical protein F5Y11DRAFT_348877 [Daldinia sp. FL1419]